MAISNLFKKTTILTFSPDDVTTIIKEYLEVRGYHVGYEDIQLNAMLNGYSVPVLRDCTVKIVDEEET